MRDTIKKMTLRLNAAEYAHLSEQAAITGMRLEPFLRKLVMGSKLRPHPPGEYAALLRELSAIGNNLNQLAHVANGTKAVNADEISEAVRLNRQAWRLVKDAF